MTLAIECRGLTRSYGARRAVQGLNLEIPPGAVVGILGPAGAGKSTLLRILATILPPEAGSFAVAGIPGDRPAEIRGVVGFLPENPSFPEYQTGLDVLVCHARLFARAGEAARATARQLLAQVGLEERATCPVSDLGRGERQRLGVARALLNRPQVLLLDEPTLGLDPAAGPRILSRIASLAREHGATVLLSTSRAAGLENVCDRVLVLDQGRVVADGPVQEVMRRRAVPSQGRLRIPPAKLDAAFRALAFLPEVASTERTDAPDELRFGLREGIESADGGAVVLASILRAGIPVLGFDIEAADASAIRGWSRVRNRLLAELPAKDVALRA